MAGSEVPEQAGVFLWLGEFEADWFVKLNNTGGPVDVWSVAGVDPEDLVESPEGHFYFPRAIPPTHVDLHRSDAV